MMESLSVGEGKSRMFTIGCRFLLASLLGMALWGCASSIKQEASQPVASPVLASAHFLAPDGRVIPVRTFLPKQRAMQGVIVALHGFNDYSRAFETVGPFFAARGVGLIAFDQRGFGLSEGTGIWAGTPSYGTDLEQMVRAVKGRYPGIPIFLLGESMGAAVAITALVKTPNIGVDGVILSAPAVWSRDTMPWYQSLVLDFAAAALPEFRLTGSGLRIRASDNLEMLRGLGRDPWVIKGTRIDAIQGLTDLMDAAQIEIDQVNVPLLILYGGKDEIIPADPVKRIWSRLSGRPEVRWAYYPAGYHLLLRDLEASIPLRDIAGWVLDRKAPLASGCELSPPLGFKEAAVFQVSGACLSGRGVSPHQGVAPE
jgi:acylglycerol lipase